MILDAILVIFEINCETNSHVLVSLAQVVVIVAQVSPTETFAEFEMLGVGFEMLIIAIFNDYLRNEASCLSLHLRFYH